MQAEHIGDSPVEHDNRDDAEDDVDAAFSSGDPAWLSFCWQWGDDSFPSEWKVIQYPQAERCMWEFRRVFFDVFDAKARCGHYLSQNWGWIHDRLRLFGFDAAEEVLLTKRQCHARGVVLTQFHRNEIVVSTPGLLAILLEWAFKKKEPHGRERVRGILLGFFRIFRDVVCGEDWLDVLELSADASSACEEDFDDETGTCGHVAEVFQEFDNEESELNSVVRCLLAAFGVAGSCPACAAWLQVAVPKIQKLIDRGTTAVELSRDPLEARIPLGPQRKRRLDEDFVKAMVWSTQESGAAGGSDNWARATGHVHPGTGHLHSGPKMKGG